MGNFYKTIVQSILLYGAETWVISTKNWDIAVPDISLSDLSGPWIWDRILDLPRERIGVVGSRALQNRSLHPKTPRQLCEE